MIHRIQANAKGAQQKDSEMVARERHRGSASQCLGIAVKHTQVSENFFKVRNKVHHLYAMQFPLHSRACRSEKPKDDQGDWLSQISIV